MELISILEPKISKATGKTQKRGLFYCDLCKKEVERDLERARKSVSCGCIRSIHRTRHGHARARDHHPLFDLWVLMKTRCYNKKYRAYHRYGGRGIAVYNDWMHNYPAFYDWAIQAGWVRGLDLDRENNDGDYEPSNCRFVAHVINIQNSTVAKLNTSVVAEIRSRHSQGGLNYKELGKIYNVTGATISHIVRRITWR